MKRVFHGHGSPKKTSPTYRSWCSMKARVDHCQDPQTRHGAYTNVKICHRWRSFPNFLADMGVRPADTTLDRIDNRKGYQPGNCRWADGKTQGSNRACVRNLTFRGRTQNPEDWARELGLRPQTIRSRIDRGWPMERVLTAPGIRGTPGEANPHAKITAAKVRELRRLHKEEGWDFSRLGKHFGLTHGAAYAAATGRSWGSVK